MNPSRHCLFVVGKITKGERKMIFLRAPLRPVFPGPWELRAIFAG